MGRCDLGPLLSVLDWVQSDSLMSSRSSFHLSLAMFTLDFAHSDPCLLLRSFCCSDFIAFVPGLNRFGFVFLLPVIDDTHLELMLSLRCFGCLGFIFLVLDHAGSEFLISMRSWSHLDFVLSACKWTSLGSLIPVLDHVTLGLATLIRSRFQLDPLLSSLDSARPESLSLSRSCTYAGPAVFVFGWVTAGSSLFISDRIYSGFFALLQSHARVESSLSPLHIAHSEFLLFLRAMVRLGLVLPAISKVSSGSLLFVLDFLHLESVMLIHSFVRLALTLPVPDLLHLESMLPLHELS